MDIKKQIQDVVNKVTKDEKVKQNFMKDPVKTVEGIVGVDLPDGATDKIVDGVKAKMAGDKLSGALDSVKGLLKK